MALFKKDKPVPILLGFHTVEFFLTVLESLPECGQEHTIDLLQSLVLDKIHLDEVFYSEDFALEIKNQRITITKGIAICKL